MIGYAPAAPCCCVFTEPLVAVALNADVAHPWPQYVGLDVDGCFGASRYALWPAAGDLFERPALARADGVFCELTASKSASIVAPGECVSTPGYAPLGPVLDAVRSYAEDLLIYNGSHRLRYRTEQVGEPTFPTNVVDARSSRSFLRTCADETGLEGLVECDGCPAPTFTPRAVVRRMFAAAPPAAAIITSGWGLVCGFDFGALLNGVEITMAPTAWTIVDGWVVEASYNFSHPSLGYAASFRFFERACISALPFGSGDAIGGSGERRLNFAEFTIGVDAGVPGSFAVWRACYFGGAGPRDVDSSDWSPGLFETSLCQFICASGPVPSLVRLTA